MNIDLGTVIARRFELVREIEREEAALKQKLLPLHEELNLCEQFVKQQMNEQGLQNVKTDAGMPYFTTKDKVRIVAWEQTLAFINEKGLHQLLTRAVSKDAVKEYMEENDGALPPGVQYEAFKDLNWRSA